MSETFTDLSQCRDPYVLQWQIMRDWMNYEVNIGFYAPFEQKIKYLAPSDGVYKDIKAGSGSAGYDRALSIYTQFHALGIAGTKGFLRKAVNGAKNTIHRQSATYELPDDFQYLIESSTDRNETLEELHQEITHRQCLFGRGGYLVDVDDKGKDDKGKAKVVFYISSYDPERVGDYGYDKTLKMKKLSFVFLDLSSYEYGTQIEKYMILGIKNGLYFQKTTKIKPVANYYNPELESEDDMIYPMYSGKMLSYIPFVLIGGNDLKMEYQIPKFSTSANLDIAYLNKRANYEQHLAENAAGIWVGDGVQDEDAKKVRFGPFGFFNLPNGGSITHSGVSADGLVEQRQSLLDLEDYAASENITNMKQLSGESGIARASIMESRTLPLIDIAMTGAAGLQQLFNFIADWANVNVEDFVVKPNINFFAKEIDSNLLKELMAAKIAGLPIPWEIILNTVDELNKDKKTVEELKQESDKEKLIKDKEIITEPAEV